MTGIEAIKAFISRLTPPPLRIYNLRGSSIALLLSLQKAPFMMVEALEEEAKALRQDILFYRKALGLNADDICFIPSPDGPEISGQRAEAVPKLGSAEAGCSAILSESALSFPLWPLESLNAGLILLHKNKEIERKEAEEGIKRLGYLPVPLVTEVGQYSFRGWVLDVFPSTGGRPIRIEFFGDVIESIRVFDIESQRSVNEIDSAVIFPAREFDDGAKTDELSIGRALFYSEAAQGECPESAATLSKFAIQNGGLDAGLFSMQGLGITPDERKDLFSIAGQLQMISKNNKVVVIASSKAQAERLKDVFMEGDLISPIIEVEEAFSYEGGVCITEGALKSGLFLPGLLVLTEAEIFGGRPAYRAIKKSKVSGLLTKIDDLQIGDYIVHRDYGIGRFIGLVHQRVEGYEYDLIALEFAEKDKLYLPVESIGKISKYHVEEGIIPPIDSLRTKRWQKTKESVKKKIKEMAEKLLKVYAERELSEGYPFSPDGELHREFDSFFSYDETPDQMNAIKEIKQDMESLKPMDRLLAGDVGYGKTEVAMRAAFKAVFDGKQVAVLVPTTLLCEQHQRIFKQRFSGFPVNIDGLSRFKTRKERLETIERLRTGGIDIIIATHALLKRDIAFYSLGLLIIDEEHRFGVRQKESIKELKKGVDVLSLSATPIPRTLQMSLSGIRTLSVIETPPEERVAVKSMVAVYGEDMIREAIEKEMQRGGQVYFVHNRIKDILKVEKMLRRVIPSARVAVAHGQMHERELEKVMMLFLNMELDVLLSTAIVGSGLDIPTANTIIINEAHKMGMADLYQLKGRVGRSNIRGYAYLLIPGLDVIQDDAKRRLQAIQELSYMGAGFRLAMKDLEIRGAGNLLGTEQSGYIKAVGFDMYVEMLEAAVSELRGIEMKEKKAPEISIRLNAYIPVDYISDTMLRLSMYRRILASRTEDDLEDIRAETIDRFGPISSPFDNLIRVMKLRLLAERASVTGVRLIDGHVRITLADDTCFNANDILEIFKEKVVFFKDGFELLLKGEAYEEVKSALMLMVQKTLSGDK